MGILTIRRQCCHTPFSIYPCSFNLPTVAINSHQAQGLSMATTQIFDFGLKGNINGFRSIIPNRQSRYCSGRNKQRSYRKSRLLDPPDIIRDQDTGLAISGREQLIFLLHNKVMPELVTAKHIPSEEEINNGLSSYFYEEADKNIIFQRGAWAISDAV